MKKSYIFYSILFLFGLWGTFTILPVWFLIYFFGGLSLIFITIYLSELFPKYHKIFDKLSTILGIIFFIILIALAVFSRLN